jgi:ribosomal protein S18 acetylase RimI-like enzyme
VDNSASYIEIHLGMPEEMRHQAAVICYEGFRRQMESLGVSQTKGIAILERSLDVELALVALQQDRLVGFVGLQYENRPFFQFQRSHFMQELGWLRGLLIFLLFNLSATVIQPTEMFINVIVVDAAMRGQGIGTSLINAVFEIARQNQFQAVVLDVVDTNPDAQRLYERMGFIPMRTRKYAYLRHLIGSSAVTTMSKRINTSDGDRSMIEPQQKPHYERNELLAQCDPNAPMSDEDRAWLDVESLGNEL